MGPRDRACRRAHGICILVGEVALVLHFQDHSLQWLSGSPKSICNILNSTMSLRVPRITQGSR